MRFTSLKSLVEFLGILRDLGFSVSLFDIPTRKYMGFYLSQCIARFVKSDNCYYMIFEREDKELLRIKIHGENNEIHFKN